ncbi:MAG: efflux RND transporter periplasmic adaptor subunit [Pseudomonadota bacterium]|nr:efflux RND transporter periplasmic adaptor subunit [Pseudomonadota bacterium]
MNLHLPFFTLLAWLALLPAAQTAAAQTTITQEIVVAQPAYREIMLTGFTRARATLPLVAETSGKVLEAAADIGQTIAGDGLFARLDPTFIELDLEANRVSQEQLRARIDYDRKEVKRHRELAGRGSTPQSTLDGLEQTLRNNSLELKSLAVQEKVLEERLSRTRILAPPGWQVTNRNIEPGQRVNAGEVVGAVADFSTLLAPFALSSEQYTALEQSRTDLKMYLPDLKREISAAVYRSNPGFDPSTRKIAVELALTGELSGRRGGLRAQLRLKLPERTGAVLLPAAAVEESYEEHWVTRENGERLRVVRLGNSGEEGLLRVVSTRIKAGDRFLLTPATTAPEGHSESRSTRQ